MVAVPTMQPGRKSFTVARNNRACVNRVIRSSEWARQDLPVRSQEEIGQLVKRISHLDAQNDERSNHQIEAEMHRRRWTKCFLRPRISFRESQKNRTQFLLVMTAALLSRVGFVVNDFRASGFLSPHD